MSNTTPIRLGVIGPGNIFRRIMQDLGKAECIKLTAVASRDLSRAQEAAKAYGAVHAFGSYEELAACPDVDLVYIATLHNFHKDQSILCMEHGKHVLCEKPMALNDHEVQAMIDCAKKNNVFLMEAMWTRFFPASVKLRELLADGKLGKIWHVAADFCFHAEFNPESRLFARELAGGALLDLGIYPLAAISMVLGAEPSAVLSAADIGPSGVDVMDHLLLKYPSGATAHALVGMHAPSAQTEVVMGEKGRVEVPNFWHPTAFTLIGGDGTAQDYAFEPEAEGHWHQFAHCCDCIRQGITDSPVMPLSESLGLAKMMTKLRAEWGVVYPEEA